MRASSPLFLAAVLFCVLAEAQTQTPPLRLLGWQQNATSPAGTDERQSSTPRTLDDKLRQQAQHRPRTDTIPGSENERLREQIQSTLRNEPSLARSRLDVEVTESQIALSGSVPTARDKQTARRLAQSYGNNRRVVDSQVNVQSAGGEPAAQGPQEQR